MSRGRASSSAHHHPSSSSSSLHAAHGVSSSNDTSTSLRWAPQHSTSTVVGAISTSPTQIYRSPSGHGTTTRSQDAAAAAASTPLPAMPLTSPNGGVFDRVVRKLSRKGKSPGGSGSSSTGGSSTPFQRRGSSSAAEQLHSDPPPYSYVTTGVRTPTMQYSPPIHRRALSRQEQRDRDRERERERQPRAEVPEWGPPPLTDQRFQQAQAEQEAAALRAAAASTQRSGSMSCRAEQRQRDKQRQPSSSSRHHHASSTVAHTPAAASQYASLASRSFDSLLTPVMSHDDAESSGPNGQTSSSVDPRPSDSPPRYAATSMATGRSGNGAQAAITPGTVTAGTAAASGLTRKPTISSTTRAKPTRDVPMASLRSSYFPAGLWVPKGGSGSTGEGTGSSSQLTEEKIRQQAKEREALVGKGPYWSIQRGWQKGVVTTLEELNRRIIKFPGSTVRFFNADELDEALAFSRADPRPPKRRSSTDDDDEGPATSADEEDEQVKRESQTSIALGRSVSLMNRKPQPHRSSRKRHPRGVQQSMSGAVTMEPPTASQPATPQAGPVQMTQRQDSSSSSGASGGGNSTDRTPLLTNATRAQVTTVLYTQDLSSLVNFYSGVVGLQVLSHFPNHQAVLSVPMSGATVHMRVSAFTPPTMSFCLSTDLPLETIESRFETTLRHHRGERERAAVEGRIVDGQAWDAVGVVEGGRDDEFMIRDPSGHLVVFALKSGSYSPTAQLASLPPRDSPRLLPQTSVGRDSPRLQPQSLPAGTVRRDSNSGTSLPRVSPRNSPRLLPQSTNNPLPRRTFSPNNPFLRARGSSTSASTPSSRPVSPAALPSSSVGGRGHTNPFLGTSSEEEEDEGSARATTAQQPIAIPRTNQGSSHGNNTAADANRHLSVHLGSPFSGFGDLSIEPTEAGGMTTSRSDRTIVPEPQQPQRAAEWTRVVDESD